MKKAVDNPHFYLKKARYSIIWVLCFLLFLSLQSCSPRMVQTGKASFYADFFQGRKTANGDVFKQRKRTAAHKSLPFGTKVKVKNLKNGKTVTVRINDRGPFVEGRIIDLSKKAARKLGMVNDGVVNVEIRYKRKKLKNGIVCALPAF